ncbi:hypothetical protein OH77DRAFT_1524846 [Trametes cingulata]|nr:hypothetical protein OH77DRAFT_1524846 [Trametes cingulata]
MSYSRVSRPWRSELSSTAARCLSATPFRPRRQRKLALEDLPLELIHEIFLLACTDGGRTGCSLSLVSKAVRALSRAARFNTLSFTAGSLWQITRFLDVLEDTLDTAKREGTPRPRVRHLCVVTAVGGYGGSPTGTKLSDFEEGVLEHHRMLKQVLPEEDLEQKNALMVRQFHGALQLLFCAVSADLESLCLLRRIGASFFSPLNDAPGARWIVCDGFPQLRELYFCDARPVFVFADPAKRRLPFCPSLIRMSVVTTRSSGPLDLQRWALQAPNLRELRIVHDTWADGTQRDNYLPALQATLGYSSRSSLWPKLDSILILYDTDASVRKEHPEHAAAHCENVKEVYYFLHERVPFAMCMAWYRKQDVRQDLVRGWRLRRNSATLYLDWLYRSAGGCGAYVPNFWEDFVKAAIRRKASVQPAKRTVWEQLLSSLGHRSRDEQRRADQAND